SDARDYWKVNKAALKEMHRQVGDLQIKNGIAVKGLLIRHLVLPENIAGSKKVFEFISKEISPKTYISIMSQYHPANRTDEFPELQRKITDKEYLRVINWAGEFGLTRGWRQEI
ncbi:MAG: radical SAM protein, partial [Elusimicrobia bacterium CG06_land_8_20_14_3_00_38_11]